MFNRNESWRVTMKSRLPALGTILVLLMAVEGCPSTDICSEPICGVARVDQEKCRERTSDPTCGEANAQVEECVLEQDICTDGKKDGKKQEAAVAGPCAAKFKAALECKSKK